MLPSDEHESKVPTTEQYTDLCTELDVVRAQLQSAQRLSEWLQAQNQELQSLLNWDKRLLSNPRIDVGARVTAYFVRREMDVLQLERRLDGTIPIDVQQLANTSGMHRNSTGRHLLTLEGRGAIRRAVERIGRQKLAACNASPGSNSTTAVSGTTPGTQVSVAPGSLFGLPGHW